jgi:hypothetical protein
MYTIQPIAESVITNEPCTLPTDWAKVRSISHTGRGGKQLKKMMKCKNEKNELEMVFTRDKVHGLLDRVYCADVSPVALQCDIRAGIWGDSCYDIDQSSAHQRAIVSAIENDANETAPRETYKALFHYVENKTAERERVATTYFKGSIQKAKNVYQALTFGSSVKNAMLKCGYKKDVNDEQLNGYVANLKMFAILLMERNPKISAEVSKVCEKENNKERKAFLKKNPSATDEQMRNAGVGVKSATRSLLALYGRNKEQHITETAIQHFIDCGVIANRRFAPCHDGIMIYKKDVDAYCEQHNKTLQTVIDECNEHVKETIGFSASFELHDIKSDHDAFFEQITKDADDFPHWPEAVKMKFDTDFFNTLSTHEEQTAYWELHFAFCVSQVKTGQLLSKDVVLSDGTVEIERELFWFSDKELMSAYGNLDHATETDDRGRPMKFVNLWLNSPSRRTYNYIDVVPYAGSYDPQRNKSADTFNAFVGYPKYIWDDKTEYTNEQMVKLLQPFFTMVMHLVGCKGYNEKGLFSHDTITPEDAENFDALMHIVGHRIVHPEQEKLPYGILIKSIQGCGKNTFSDAIARLVGLSLYKCSSNIEDFCGTHAEGMMGRLFCVMNEAEISNTGKYKNAVKEFISEEKATCNAKYQRPFEYALRALILVFSNESCPINLDTTGRDRRWLAFEANDFCAKRWGQNVWKKLREHFKKHEFLRALKQYFLTLDYDGFDYKKAKNKNSKGDAYKKVAQYFYPSEVLFIQHFIESKQWSTDPHGNFFKAWDVSKTYKAKELYEHAQQYFKDTNNDRALARKYNSFNSSLEKHNMGFTKGKDATSSKAPTWTFNVKDVYTWLIKNQYVDEDHIGDDLKEALGDVEEKHLDIDDLGFDI